jgi:hypothetical protein
MNKTQLLPMFSVHEVRIVYHFKYSTRVDTFLHCYNHQIIIDSVFHINRVNVLHDLVI